MSKTHSLTEKMDLDKESTVVYVTDQYACENLILQGKTIADQTDTNLYVVNVSSTGSGERPIDLNALEYLYQTSRKHGAIMNVFYEDDILSILKKTAKNYHAKNIVIGAPRQETSILTSFLKDSKKKRCYMVYPSGNYRRVNEKTCMLPEEESKMPDSEREVQYS